MLKFNGWRALIHTPSGTMWNRHSALLSIANSFQPALGALAKLASRGHVWADCEGRSAGTISVAARSSCSNMVPGFGTPTYVRRRSTLEALLPIDAVFSGDTSRPVPSGSMVLSSTIRVDSHADALAFYQRLRAANRTMGCDFFEGVVMKRADSIYPVQMRSATEEFRAGRNIGF